MALLIKKKNSIANSERKLWTVFLLFKGKITGQASWKSQQLSRQGRWRRREKAMPFELGVEVSHVADK